MADGKTHEKYAIITGVSISVCSSISYILGVTNFEQSTSLIRGAIAGFLITPDADHEARTIEETRFGNIFLLLTHKIWYLKKKKKIAEWKLKIAKAINMIHKIILTPYAIVIPHRGFFSHAPFVGTFFRIVYLFILYNIFILQNFDIQIIINSFYQQITYNNILMFLSWSIQDIMHTHKDEYGIKKIWKKK